MNKNIWVIASNLATRMGGQIMPVNENELIVNFSVDGRLEKLKVTYDGRQYTMSVDSGATFVLYEETMWDPSHIGQFLGMPTWYSVLSGVVAKVLKTVKSPRKVLSVSKPTTLITPATKTPIRQRPPQHPLWREIGINFNLDVTGLGLPKFYIPVAGFRDGIITRLIGDNDFHPDKTTIEFDTNGKLCCYYRVSFGHLKSVLELTDRITRSTNFHSSEISRKENGEWIDNVVFKDATELLAVAKTLKAEVEKNPEAKCLVSIWIPDRELGFGGKWEIVDLTNYLPEE